MWKWNGTRFDTISPVGFPHALTLPWLQIKYRPENMENDRLGRPPKSKKKKKKTKKKSKSKSKKTRKVKAKAGSPASKNSKKSKQRKHP